MTIVPKAPAALVSRRRISWPKRLCFTLVCLCLLTGFVELVCYIGLKWITYATVAQVRHNREMDADYESEKLDYAREVNHPYVGWTRNPGFHSPELFEGREFQPNDFGLVDEGSPIRKRSPDKIIVAVAGGSVSWQMTASGEGAFLRELRRQPRFQGKQVELVRLAVSGFKQPQQLMLLTFLLSLGAEFDVLVNIDGYNETALHPVENALGGVFPPYPRAWRARLSDTINLQDLQTKAALLSSIARRRARSKWYRQLPFQDSATINFLWLSLHHRYLQQEVEWNMKVLAAQLERPGYQVLGPKQTFRDDAEMFDYLVEYWAQCSRQMRLLCQANSIQYYHVLPPNQYLAGSKPQMTEQEKTVAFLESKYSATATRAYPLLVKKGQELRNEGLKFYDLTQLFSAVDEPTYIDNFCHYNVAGNALFAAAVAKILGTP
ncbi:MAG: hypothetical protein JWM11_1552 [Planctomycetaceae bacterium]|nr:hypothetical protein [Planctomycetaceae bacterium]